MSKFEIKRNRNKEFYFTLKAGNNKEILNSRPFPSIPELKTALREARASVDNDALYELKNEEGAFTFVFNGVIESKVYASELSRKNGIKAVKKNISEAIGASLNPVILS